MADIIRAGALSEYGNLMQELGEAPDEWLADVGLTEQQLADPDRYLAYSRVLLAIEAPALKRSIRDFGLRLADRQSLDFLGTLALAIRNAGSIRAGILAVCKHLSFHTPGAKVELSEKVHANQVLVKFRLLVSPMPAMPQSTEHAVAHIVKVVRLLSEGRIKPQRICFRHAMQGESASYRQYLGQQPDFLADFDGIVLDTAESRQPLPIQNPELQSFIERFLMASAPANDEPFEEQVRDVLMRLMMVRPAGLADLAIAMHLHPRTLQRRLASHAVTFEQIQDDIRQKLCLKYLHEPSIPLSHIAVLVGYSDQSVLTRSCRRWFGKTPTQLRREHSLPEV